MKNPFLKGQLVYLQGIELENLPTISQWFADDEVTRYLEMGYKPLSLENLKDEYYREIKSENDFPFMIMDNKTDAPIGLAGLYTTNWIKRSTDLRVFLGDKNFWKGNFALEVEKLLIDYGFNTLNLHRIQGGANIENLGACALMEKIGMKKEGVFRDYIFRNGQYYDAVMYSILYSDYKYNKGK